MDRKENLIEKVNGWINGGHRAAIATVIATWGSSPRPVGSQMVVNDLEDFQGSVSGGCIESTIITEAHFVIRDNEPKRLSIGIDSRKAWDYGLGCGGSIDIYIEPVTPWTAVLERLSKSISCQYPCCLITNLSTGSKELFCPDLQVTSSKLAGDLQLASEDVIASGQSRLVKKGNADFFLQGFLPPQRMIIGGAVHIAQSLVKMAQLLEYQCTIIDPRTAYATEKRFPGVKFIIEDFKKKVNDLQLDSSTAVVVLSHSPQFDDPILVHALKANVAYIGALGSKKTHADRINRLGKYGFTSDQLEKIHGPIGLDIGSKTPSEIALSIMAEITHKKRKRIIANSSTFDFST